jgi:hypothetical protein
MPGDGSDARVDVAQWIHRYSLAVLEDFRRSDVPGDDAGVPARADAAVRRLLSARLPARYGVDAGVVIDMNGGQTKPFGALIIDHERMPALHAEGEQGVWPFESVYAAVEIREKLTSDELRSAVENIASFKQLTREETTSVSGTGFTVQGELANPPLGLLIAREAAADLTPSGDSFSAVVASVGPEHRLDGYCIVTGAVGCLGKELPRGLGLLLGFSNKGGTKLFHFSFGDGALAAFLLMVTGILNKIRLGEPALVHYLRSASP